MNIPNSIYMAGVLDARGHFRVRTGDRGYELAVTNSNKAWLESLSERCGGRGNVSMAGNTWRWAVYSQPDIYHVLSHTHDYMMTAKKSKARAIVEHLDPDTGAAAVAKYKAEQAKKNSRSMYG